MQSTLSAGLHPAPIRPQRVDRSLVLPPDSRGLIVGNSGSGKSYLAKNILVNITSPVIIDSKWDFEPLGDAVVFHSPSAFLAGWINVPEPVNILYRPDTEYDDIDSYDVVLMEIFNAAREGRRRSTTYIDEVTLVAPSSQKYPRGLRALSNQGRSLGAALLAVTQRPSNIPMFLIGNALLCWMFALNLEEDIIRMSGIMGAEVKTPLARYAYWWRDVVNEPRPYPMILRG